MPTRALSISEIRRWLTGAFTFGKSQWKTRVPRDLPRLGFCRSVGIDNGDLHRFIAGKTSISPRLQRLISKFIADWEAGMLEFAPGKPRRLVHRTTPRPRPPRLVVVFDHGAKLKLLPRLPASGARIFLTAKTK